MAPPSSQQISFTSNGEPMKLNRYKKGADIAKEALAARNLKEQFERQEEAWTAGFLKEVAKYKVGDECIAKASVHGMMNVRSEIKPMRVRIAIPPIGILEENGYAVIYNVTFLTSNGKVSKQRYNINVLEEDLEPFEGK